MRIKGLNIHHWHLTGSQTCYFYLFFCIVSTTTTPICFNFNFYAASRNKKFVFGFYFIYFFHGGVWRTQLKSFISMMEHFWGSLLLRPVVLTDTSEPLSARHKAQGTGHWDCPQTPNKIIQINGLSYSFWGEIFNNIFGANNNGNMVIIMVIFREALTLS